MATHLDPTGSSRRPDLIDGIPCYAPSLALAGEDYPIGAYEQLYEQEERHFWFRARNRIILWAMQRFVAEPRNPRLLEVGCGTGYVLQGFAAAKRYHLTGAEVHISGLRYARQRPPDVEFVQLDARDLPYAAVFDIVGAFDVIEHIEEDVTVLQSVHHALKPRGVIVLTVPQHKWLWSAVDEYARHKRRYTRPELLAKLSATGFEDAQRLPAARSGRLAAADQRQRPRRLGNGGNRPVGPRQAQAPADLLLRCRGS